MIDARADAYYGQRRLQIESLRRGRRRPLRTQASSSDYRSALDRHDGRRPVSGRQVLANARHAVRHRADVIAALDFRGRGWVLAGRPDGRPLALRGRASSAGDALELRFHDGRAVRQAREEFETGRRRRTG